MYKLLLKYRGPKNNALLGVAKILDDGIAVVEREETIFHSAKTS